MTYLDHIVKSNGKTTFFSKFERTVKKFRVNTQRIRTELILDLKELADFARDRVHDSRIKGSKQKQRWAQLAAYIARSVNIIAKEYDEKKIAAKLDEIRRLVETEIQEGNSEA